MIIIICQLNNVGETILTNRFDGAKNRLNSCRSHVNVLQSRLFSIATESPTLYYFSLAFLQRLFHILPRVNGWIMNGFYGFLPIFSLSE